MFTLARRLADSSYAQAEKRLRRKIKNGAMKKQCNNPQQAAPERLHPGEERHRTLSQHQVSDIAERERTQEALHESEQRYRRIVETTHEGIWMADLNGITTFVNPQMSRMLGSTPERMIGRPVFDFVFEEDRALVRQHFAEFLQQPGGKRVEERLRRSDGTELWAVASASVLLDAHSQPVSFLGMFTDITDHKRAEEGLRKSEARLQLQINRMPIAHILWNSQFQVLSWNPAAERMFGYTEQEALGKHPYDLIVSRAVQPEVDEIWQRLLQGDTTAHSVNANLTKEGRRIICQWSNTPIKESDGTVVGVLSMAQDITKRVRAEEALRDAQHKLEMRVQERTAELQASNQALAESEEKYRRLFETISDAAFVFEAESRQVCGSERSGVAAIWLHPRGVPPTHPRRDHRRAGGFRGDDPAYAGGSGASNSTPLPQEEGRSHLPGRNLRQHLYA